MYSGGDSNGDGYSDFNRFGHFQLPGTTGCNLGNTGGSIDWASLAQQWIQMRDCSAAEVPATMPEPPPPPNISGISVQCQMSINDTNANDELSCAKKSRFDEKGEADMEMDDEEESGRLLQNAARHHISENVSAPLFQPNWFMQNSLEPVGIPTETIPTQPSQDSSQWGMWPTRVLLAPSSSIHEIANPTSHIPSLMKINIPHPSASPALIVPSAQRETNPAPVVDTAKRKILPAWIREGLEKMEREKQKLIEKQQTHLNEDVGLDYGDATLEPINTDTVNNKNLPNVESDNSVNEDDDNEKVYESTSTSYVDKTAIDSHELPNSDREEQVDAQNNEKTYEQKLSDMMIVVRRTLTELLLEVTNEEISTISGDAIKAYKTKASAAQVISKSAIATITGKLGLAAYEDSSSASSGSEEDDEAFKENISDSEEEIKGSIRLKHKTFAKISEEIEKRIAESDLREEQKLKYYTQQETQHHEIEESNQNDSTGSQVDLEGSTCGISICNPYRPVGSGGADPSPYGTGKDYELEFGETTDTKLQFSNGKRQKERTTRFSDNKNSRGGGLGIVATPDLISQFKGINHTENVTRTINSTVLQKPSDVCLKSVPDISSKSADQAFNNVMIAAEKTLSKEKRYRGRHHRVRSNTSDNNDSSTNSESSETSTSQSSSRNSKSSRSKYKRNRHTHRPARSDSSTRKSSRARSRDRYSDRYKYDRKSRHRRDHSSDSDDYSDSKYSNSKTRRTKRSKTHYHDYHRRERKSKRSRSRSRSKSSYSSSRRRH